MTWPVAQGPHDHLITFDTTTGPLWLWVLLVLGSIAVAGFGVVRPFLGRQGRATVIGVTATAAGTGLLQLLLTEGLDLPQQAALLVLLLLAVPVLVARQRDPRFEKAARRARRAAPVVVLLAAVGASVEFARAWSGAGEQTSSLHTGLVIALAGLSWFAICAARSRPVAVGTHVVVWSLANATTAATAHVALLSALTV
ncbi:DUF6239 family natural product biosynthesis protein [Saccharopolyspora indica]|uniref:DUF6239 family natural product biosynthesis protein n=1 Tax=Saccharopolyspora indica TaxID=1229659 RepID=UPI0022EB8CFA|nr:DUF6239 family natural product biosynthesis protein [Saccharopolyspora indica]MDA3646993.1 DUF6239 family natural product biosynthesis protein [Saccharopolyspora indica]